MNNIICHELVTVYARVRQALFTRSEPATTCNNSLCQLLSAQVSSKYTFIRTLNNQRSQEMQLYAQRVLQKCIILMFRFRRFLRVLLPYDEESFHSAHRRGQKRSAITC